MGSLKPFCGLQSKNHGYSSFFDKAQLLGAGHFPILAQTRMTFIELLSVPRPRPASFRTGPQPSDPEQLQDAGPERESVGGEER